MTDVPKPSDLPGVQLPPPRELRFDPSSQRFSWESEPGAKDQARSSRHVDTRDVGDYNNQRPLQEIGMPRAPLHLRTLPRAQLGLWPALAEFKDAFVLYGGTALALQLGHRDSIDFDFFSSHGFEPGALRARFRLLQDVEVLQSSPNTLMALKKGVWGDVKLSFFGGLNLKRVGVPVTSPDNGLRVASVLDLAGTKIKVLQDRAELKDYLDIAAILEHGVALGDAIQAAMAIYGEDFNPMVSLKALTYFEDGDVKDLKPDARRALETAVVGVDIQALHPLPAGPEPFDLDADRVPDETLLSRRGMEQ